MFTTSSYKRAGLREWFPQMELDSKTRRHIESKVDDLTEELGGAVERARVAAVVEDTLQTLDGARFPDFVPILTYRFARERLRSVTP